MNRFQRAVTVPGAALLLIAVLSGCSGDARDSIISAVGSYGDIAVILSDPELEPHLETFRGLLAPQQTFVIKQEPTYRFQTFQGKHWKDGRNYRNLLFVCHWGSGGPVQSAVEGMVPEERLRSLLSGRGGVVTLRDPFFRNQMAIVAVARRPNDLIRVLNAQAAALGDTLARDIDRRILADNRSHGLLADVARNAWRRFGFSIELPAVFRENQTRPDGYPGVEWIRTDVATRGLTVSWADVEDPDARLKDRNFLSEMRNSLGEALHSESLDPDSFDWTTELVDGRPAVKLAGNWTSRRVGAGGTFWSYFLAAPERGRVYCFDLLVYAPNKDKMDYFRRLRALLESVSFTEPTG